MCAASIRVLALDLGKTTNVYYLHLLVDYQLERGITLPADLVDDGELSELADLEPRQNRLSGSIPAELGSFQPLDLQPSVVLPPSAAFGRSQSPLLRTTERHIHPKLYRNTYKAHHSNMSLLRLSQYNIATLCTS